MTRRLRALPAAALAALVLAAPAAAHDEPAAVGYPVHAQSSSCPGADAIPTANDLVLVRRATLCLLNRERTALGLPRLHSSRRLRQAATAYSHSMTRHDFFAHVSAVTGSTVVERVRATGYLRHARSWTLGENILWGSGTLATPREAVRAWMHSPGHRRNILTRGFREIGIGVALGAPVHLDPGQAAATYTTDFGGRG